MKSIRPHIDRCYAAGHYRRRRTQRVWRLCIRVRAERRTACINHSTRAWKRWRVYWSSVGSFDSTSRNAAHEAYTMYTCECACVYGLIIIRFFFSLLDLSRSYPSQTPCLTIMLFLFSFFFHPHFRFYTHRRLGGIWYTATTRTPPQQQ